MHVSLQIQNGKAVPLLQMIDNQDGRFKIALCEILYYPEWHSIDRELGNNSFQIGDKTDIIPDGYYSMCKLLDYIFKPLGWSLMLNEVTVLVNLEKKI